VCIDQGYDDELILALVRFHQLREHDFIGTTGWTRVLGLDDGTVALVDLTEE